MFANTLAIIFLLTINSLFGKKKLNPCSILKIDNQLTSDAVTIANHFNLLFVEAGIKLVNKLPPTSHNFKQFLPFPIPKSLYFNPTTPLEIKRIVTDLMPKNNCGTDEISKVLKSTPENILLALAHVLNLSLSSGKSIDVFKVTKKYLYLKKV